MSNEVEKLSDLNKRIEALKVRKMASEKEKERLEEELNTCKLEVKEKYGVEIEDFNDAINVAKDNYIKKINELNKLVSEAESKISEIKPKDIK